jgi:hypothetical protein
MIFVTVHDHAVTAHSTGGRMPDDHDQLDRLLKPWIRADRTPTDLPILLLWAPRGSGVEMLLNQYRAQWVRPNVGGLGPLAFVNGGDLRDTMRPHEVALSLTWELGKSIPRLGKLRFPRFMIGLAAARGPVGADPDQARRDIKAMLRGRNGPPPTWLPPIVTGVANAAGIGDQTANLAGETSAALFGAAREWITRRSPGVAWYRTGLDQPFADPYQALADLSRRKADDTWVDEVLCRAFLADVRSAYDNRWRWFARNYNPLLLIDDAAHPAVSRFLESLTGVGGPTPLAVVAASGVRQEVRGSPPHDCHPATFTDASLESWTAPANAHPPGWERHYPTVLGWAPDPTPGGLWIRERAERRDLKEVFADRLTAGHPYGLERVREILETSTDPRRVFTGDRGEKLEADILKWVCGTSPALPEGVAIQLALLPDLGSKPLESIRPALAVRNRVEQYLKTDLWVARSAAGVLKMHPLARRALAHRLARGPVGGLSWQSCHEQLRNVAEGRDDPTTALYHRLALGEVRTVATELSATLSDSRPDDWYQQLLSVTEAPVQNPGLHPSAVNHRDALVQAGGGSGHTRVQPSLVAALQLHTDPLGDPYHELCEGIATDLYALATGPAAQMDVLGARAAEFWQCSQSWNRHRGQ